MSGNSNLHPQSGENPILIQISFQVTWRKVFSIKNAEEEKLFHHPVLSLKKENLVSGIIESSDEE